MKALISDLNIRAFKDRVKVNIVPLFDTIYDKIKTKYDFKEVEGVPVPFQKGKELRVLNQGKVGEFADLESVLEDEYKLFDA